MIGAAGADMRQDNRQFRRAVVPIYKTIKEEIVDDILSGLFQPGDQIPTQEYYADKYGVSRIVVRSAINELIEKELLISRKGKGTFVNQIYSDMLTPFKYSGFSEGIKDKGAASSRVIRIASETAKAKISRYLAIPDGTEVVVIERVRMLMGKPISCEVAYMDRQKVGHVDFEGAHLERHSLFALLREQAGLVPSHSQEEIRAVSCPAYQASLLNISEGDPIAYLKIRTLTEDQTVMAYSEVFQNTETMEIRIKTNTI